VIPTAGGALRGAGRPALACDEIGDVGEVDAGLPALLLLHAFPLSRRMWRPQLAGLADCCRVLAPDLPGFGESPPATAAAGAASAGGVTSGSAAADGSGEGEGAAAGGSGEVEGEGAAAGGSAAATVAVCGMEDMAAATVAVLDALGIAAAVVCGLSMGGYVALALYERFRERVRGLVLADTRASADDEAARRRRLESAAEVESHGSAALVDTLLPRLIAPRTLTTRPELVAWLRQEIATAPAAGVAAALRGMAARPDRSPLLPRIAVPALIVCGEEDEFSPPAEGRRLSEQIPGARLAIIPAAGHLSNLEQPELFNRELRDFLGGFGAAARGTANLRGSGG
jgi:3-oxoadipate enol-lactonase